MGTSVNQSSPRTLNWNAVQAGYRDKDVPIARLLTEIWRAASNQPSGNISELLARPVIASIGQLVAEAKTSEDLARKSAYVIAHSKESSLASDIARRAAIQSVVAPNPIGSFAERVFAEATAYLVSRDLPGFVGTGRAKNVADSLELKSAIVNRASEVARSVPVPKSLNAESWSHHVVTVLTTLSGRKR